MNEFSTDEKLSSKAGRQSPKHRALLGIAGLLVIGSIATACGASNGSPSKGGNMPTTTAPAGGVTNTTGGGGGGVGF